MQNTVLVKSGVLALLLAGLWGCQTDNDSAGCSRVFEMSDSQKMLLIQCMPIGASYAQAKQLLPELSTLRPEGSSSELGLQEATAPITILNRQAELEINFKDSLLYAYLYWVRDSTEAFGDSLYKQVVDFYSAHYGAASVETEAEPGYTYSGSYWCPRGYGVVVGQSDYSAYSLVAWGFQDRCPGTPPNSPLQPPPDPGD